MSIERIETKSITLRWLVNGYVAGTATIERGNLTFYNVEKASMEQDWLGLFEFNKAIAEEAKAQQNTRD